MNNKKSSIFANHSFQEALVFFALSVWLIVYSYTKHYSGMKYDWKMSPYLFPIVVSVFLFLLSAALLFQAIREYRKNRGADGEEKAYFNYFNFIATIALAAAYYFALKFVPFVIATAVHLAVMRILFKEKRGWIILLVSVLTSGIVYLLFSVGLHVNLP